MNRLTRKTLKNFLQLAGNNLSGEWVLMGGTLLPILGIDYRVTVDIDIVAVKEPNQLQTVRLMEIAESLNLPVEIINEAAQYFLHKIPNYEKHLLPLHKGKKATIYRPDLELYIRLKIARMSESDLNDCIEYLKYTKKNREEISKKITTYINKAIVTRTDDEKKQRLINLLEHFVRF